MLFVIVLMDKQQTSIQTCSTNTLAKTQTLYPSLPLVSKTMSTPLSMTTTSSVLLNGSGPKRPLPSVDPHADALPLSSIPSQTPNESSRQGIVEDALRQLQETRKQKFLQSQAALATHSGVSSSSPSPHVAYPAIQHQAIPFISSPLLQKQQQQQQQTTSYASIQQAIPPFRSPPPPQPAAKRQPVLYQVPARPKDPNETATTQNKCTEAITNKEAQTRQHAEHVRRVESALNAIRLGLPNHIMGIRSKPVGTIEPSALEKGSHEHEMAQHEHFVSFLVAALRKDPKAYMDARDKACRASGGPIIYHVSEQFPVLLDTKAAYTITGSTADVLFITTAYIVARFFPHLVPEDAPRLDLPKRPAASSEDPNQITPDDLRGLLPDINRIIRLPSGGFVPATDKSQVRPPPRSSYYS